MAGYSIKDSVKSFKTIKCPPRTTPPSDLLLLFFTNATSTTILIHLIYKMSYFLNKLCSLLTISTFSLFPFILHNLTSALAIALKTSLMSPPMNCTVPYLMDTYQISLLFFFASFSFPVSLMVFSSFVCSKGCLYILRYFAHSTHSTWTISFTFDFKHYWHKVTAKSINAAQILSQYLPRLLTGTIDRDSNLAYHLFSFSKNIYWWPTLHTGIQQ